ncbi:hypothetical protein D3C71_1968150 [compost metagenome]
MSLAFVAAKVKVEEEAVIGLPMAKFVSLPPPVPFRVTELLGEDELPAASLAMT